MGPGDGWRRGQTDGTIICDLVKRKGLTLMSSRDAEAVEAGLRTGPNIRIIARDKLLKRQMYGRGKIDLVFARLGQAARPENGAPVHSN